MAQTTVSRKEIFAKASKSVRKAQICVAIICIFGLCLCVYALKVEIYKEHNSSYKALCDLNEWISCSKVFTSKYGRGFGLMPENTLLNQPNSVFGILFYMMQVILLFLKSEAALKAKVGLSVISNVGSIYLAYILYFILSDFCIVCVTTYFINALLLIANLWHYRSHVKLASVKKTSQKKAE